jgi:chromosome segregation ATPase
MDDNEIHSLKEEIIDLRSKLDHAASAGLALLQTNEDMNKQHEKDVQSYNEQLEQLKQENFTLSNKLSHQTSTHQAFLDELEHVKTETEGKYEQKIKTMEQSYQMKLQDMKYRFEEIERELNSCINNEKLLKEKVTTQEGTIASLREQIVTDGNWNNNDEVDEMRRLCTTLECSNEELKSKVSDLTSQLGTSSDAVRSLENKVNELEESLCDRVKLSNEWYSNLMEVQDLNKVLQNQLDVFKLGQLEEDWQNSGNSLFGEVEERRLDTERKYISLQVKHDALEKRYQALQQQYKQLKTQVSALMCRLGTTNADAAQIERLQRSLYLKDNQIQSLTNKVHKLEREKNKASPVNSLKKADQFEDEKGYTLYLKKQIEGQE